MEHFYEKIDGWFTFNKLYSDMVGSGSDTSIFVEVGTWKGRSAAYMAVEIANSKKNIKFYCVDPWTGESQDGKDGKTHPEYNCIEIVENTLFNTFLTNIEPVKDYIIPLRMYSEEAYLQFEDSSLDFVFIDASHDFKNVKKDIDLWLPKIKSGGVIGGHDYHTKFPGVIKAVESFHHDSNEISSRYVDKKNRVWYSFKK